MTASTASVIALHTHTHTHTQTPTHTHTHDVDMADDAAWMPPPLTRPVAAQDMRT